MTALCAGGGASSPKPGVSEVIILGAGIAETLLTRFAWSWAWPLMPVLPVISYDTINACSSDPPGFINVSSAEAQAMLKLDVTNPDFVNGVKHMLQNVQTMLWYDNCQCNAGPQPTEPGALSPPAGMPTVVYPNPPGVPCRTLVLPSVTFTGGTSTSMTGTGGPPADVNPFLAGETGMRVTVFSDNTGGAQPAYDVHVSEDIGTAEGELIGGDSTFHLAAGATGSTFVPRDTEAGVYEIRITTNPLLPSTDTYHCTCEFYCGGATPTGPVVGPTGAPGCCPPDPSLVKMIQQVLTLTTLMQRQLAPFAYIASTAHAGLVNTGTIAVQGLLGVKVNVTATPGTNRIIAGEPDYIYDLGWLSIETADGFIDEVRLRNTTQVWLPRMMSDATKIGYSLRAGVTATFTELAREP